MSFKRDKFKELILYISEKSKDDPKFGATKLNKILFYSDFVAYGKLGKPITGASYQRLGNGPAPRELRPIRRELETEKDIILETRPYRGKSQNRVVPIRDARLSHFSAEEISIVDEIMKELREDNGTEVSKRSHDFLGWKYAAHMEEIPYYTVFVDSIEPYHCP